MSSGIHIQSNQGNPSSREPCNNTQSGLSNSNGTIISEEEKLTFALSWKEQNCYDTLSYRICFWEFLAHRKSLVELI